MPILHHIGTIGTPRVTGPEAMVETVMDLGIVPFFANCIGGYSIEELTPAGYWFDDEVLGPWDWKIACVQCGEIAYGKFLLGGKAAFATKEWYRELRNYRRSLPKNVPKEQQKAILDYVDERGSITMREVRRLLDVKKGVADAIMARLEHQTRLVIGDIQRVYRGPDLHYNGWQTATFTTPEAMFESASSTPGIGGFPFAGDDFTLKSSHTPAESLELIKQHIVSLAPHATEKDLVKILG